MTVYGYVRVSHTEQNEARQVIAMHEVGISDENIFIDKKSGKDFNRPQYKKLIRKLKKDDILYIHAIDRLGRNYDEIQEQWRHITKQKQAFIVVITMPPLDTREDRNLIGRVIADVVLQLLSFVAQSEREAIRMRQAEGIAAAKARGVKFGRRKLPMPENFDEVYDAWKNRRISPPECAKLCNMSLSAFYSRVRPRRHEELKNNPVPKKARDPSKPKRVCQKRDYIVFDNFRDMDVRRRSYHLWLNGRITLQKAVERIETTEQEFMSFVDKVESGYLLRVQDPLTKFYKRYHVCTTKNRQAIIKDEKTDTDERSGE